MLRIIAIKEHPNGPNSIWVRPTLLAELQIDLQKVFLVIL